MSALTLLLAAKSRADAAANLEKYIASRRAAGWSEADIADYRAAIRTLMGDDEAAAMALFPEGAYKTAEHAREVARKYWTMLS